MEQIEIAELKKRVQQLEEMALEMHKSVYSASVSTHQIEEAIRKLNFFSRLLRLVWKLGRVIGK